MTVKEAAKLLTRLTEAGKGDEDFYMAQPTHDHWHNVKAILITRIVHQPARPSSYYDDALILDHDTNDTRLIIIAE